MRGELLYRWHRNILSLKSLWTGVLLLIISVIWLPRIANRNSADTSGYERILSLLPVLGVVLSVALIIVAVLRAAFTRYTVYERRIDFGTGIFYQRRNPIWLYDVTDISLRRSPLLILTRTAAIDIKYDTSKKKAGSESIVAASSSPRMRDFMERLQERVLRERRAMKKMWI
jgi:membrane protein YdbS with pleckstrin-like domain